MKQPLKALWGWILFLCFACVSARAQNIQFLPEFDAHLKLNPAVRVYLEAKEDRDGGDPTQFTVGPSIQIYSKPLLRFSDRMKSDIDDSKSRALVLEAGYRSISAPDAPHENRMVVSMTSHIPMRAELLLTERNRADLDWKNGVFNWRYRNKLTLERTFPIGSYHLIPYAAVEPFYESQYDKWSTTSLYAGGLFPVGKHAEFNAYFEHDNNTGKSPNRQVNSLGLALNLFFSLK